MKRKPALSLQTPDMKRSLDAQVGKFWEWRNHGCPHNGSVDSDTQDLIDACQSDSDITLSALAGHQSEWVRFAVAANPYTPSWALWGDGISSFGLAEDKSAWVTAAVLLRQLQPPQIVIDNLRLFKQETPPEILTGL